MKVLKTLAAAAALAFAATSASAAVMSATYTGVLTNGIDEDGYFGAPGADLSGQAFSVNFVYDTAQGLISPYFGGQALAGGWLGAPPYQPLLSMSLTILGHTEATTGDASGDFSSTVTTIFPDFPAYHPGTTAQGEVCHNGEREPVGLYFATCMRTAGPVPSDLVTGFSAAADPLEWGYAMFYLPGGDGPFPHYYVEGRSMNLVVTKLRESPGGVPEPGVWALMILGFGAAGAMLRRRPVIA